MEIDLFSVSILVVTGFVAGIIRSMNLTNVRVKDKQHVLIGDAPIKLNNAVDASITSGLIGFRPEAVKIMDHDDDSVVQQQEAMDNITLMAKIKEVTFMGAFCRLQLLLVLSDKSGEDISIELDISSQHSLIVNKTLTEQKDALVNLQIARKNLHFYPETQAEVAA